MKSIKRRQFLAMRRAHSLEAAEDYTELIADLIARFGAARTCDIAAAMGISHVTALRTVQRLQREGYVVTAPREPISLTAKGHRTAAAARRRHELLVRFFVSIGVPLEAAQVDAEGAEHHISGITLECIERFLAGGA